MMQLEQFLSDRLREVLAERRVFFAIGSLPKLSAGEPFW